MAFMLKPKTDSFFYPVQVAEVSESGATQIHKFEFRFKRVSRSKLDEIQTWQNEIRNSELRVNALDTDTDWVMEVAENWRHVLDETGAEAVFSRDNVRALLDSYPGAALTIVNAFYSATLGGAKKGN